MNEKDELQSFLKTNRPTVETKSPRTEAHGIWHKINVAKQSYESVWAYAVPIFAAVMVMMYVSQTDVKQVNLSTETMTSVGSALNMEQFDDEVDEDLVFIASFME